MSGIALPSKGILKPRGSLQVEDADSSVHPCSLSSRHTDLRSQSSILIIYTRHSRRGPGHLEGHPHDECLRVAFGRSLQQVSPLGEVRAEAQCMCTAGQRMTAGPLSDLSRAQDLGTPEDLSLLCGLLCSALQGHVSMDDSDIVGS